VKGWTELYLNL